MTEAVIVSTARTPIGNAYRGASQQHRSRDAAWPRYFSSGFSAPRSMPAEMEDVVMGQRCSRAQQAAILRASIAARGLACERCRAQPLIVSAPRACRPSRLLHAR